MEKKQQEELKQVQADHFINLRNFDSEFATKCEEQMDINRRLDDYNSELL